MFEHLDAVKPALKRLIAELRKEYPYASVLAVEDDYRKWTISRAGRSISTKGLGGGNGYCVRVFDSFGCCEYSFNEFGESRIPEIVRTVRERTRALREALPAGTEPLKTPIPADEPCVLQKQTAYRIHPRELGDEAIFGRLQALRESGMAHEGMLDFNTSCLYRAYRKLFLSENRDLDQTCMYTDLTMLGMCSKGQQIRNYYYPKSILGGAEVLEDAEEMIGYVCETCLALCDAEPLKPGTYDCICTPETTGMIVHEAFGHGVEEDMFVKDRAQAVAFMGKRVASDLVTMRDGSAVDQTATFFFDDEGTLSGDTLVIEKGILKSGYADALTAARLGIAPTGNGRRESYERKVYTRMTNTWFEAGSATLEEMLASVKDGLWLEMPTSGMEDPKNWGIQCMVEFAREIKDGKFTGKLYSPVVLTGYVPDLLKSISMMSSGLELCGTGYCGKGHKEYLVVSDGGPYIRAQICLG